MWCDSHCHLQYETVAARASDRAVDRAIERAVAAGVGRMICIGTDAEQSAAAIAIARRHPDQVWATVGLHPHDAKNQVEGIIGLLDAPEAVAVGECGLDYHYDQSPRPVQREVFAAQIDLAAERGLALVVHTREAWDDTFAILESGPRVPTLFHCFSGGPAEARKALDLGAWLSFSGIVTFKTAGELREAAALAPLERILVETDSPFLTPVPHRGRPNEPAYVPLVGAAVAAARSVAVEVVEDATWANAQELFGRPHSE